MFDTARGEWYCLSSHRYCIRAHAAGRERSYRYLLSSSHGPRIVFLGDGPSMTTWPGSLWPSSSFPRAEDRDREHLYVHQLPWWQLSLPGSWHLRHDWRTCGLLLEHLLYRMAAPWPPSWCGCRAKGSAWASPNSRNHDSQRLPRFRSAADVEICRGDLLDVRERPQPGSSSTTTGRTIEQVRRMLRGPLHEPRGGRHLRADRPRDRGP